MHNRQAVVHFRSLYCFSLDSLSFFMWTSIPSRNVAPMFDLLLYVSFEIKAYDDGQDFCFITKLSEKQWIKHLSNASQAKTSKGYLKLCTKGWLCNQPFNNDMSSTVL